MRHYPRLLRARSMTRSRQAITSEHSEGAHLNTRNEMGVLTTLIALAVGSRLLLQLPTF